VDKQIDNMLTILHENGRLGRAIGEEVWKKVNRGG
jgi:hypothetical protein